MSDHDSSNQNRGVVAWFVQNELAAKILFVIIVLGGISGLVSMPQEVFPPFAPSLVNISIPVRGGTAKEVEELVVKAVEESLDGISGVERIIANASNEGTQLSIELAAEVNQQSMLNIIKSRVDGISTLPTSSEPAIYTLPEKSGPVKFVSVSGDFSSSVLLGYAVELKNKLNLLEGVLFAVIDNEPELSIYIEVPPENLIKYDLTLEEISSAVRKSSINTSGGYIQSTSGVFQIRADTMGHSVQDFRAIEIVSPAFGEPILLGDFASIKLSPNDKYIQGKFNGYPSFTLSVYRDPNVPFSKVNKLIEDEITRFNKSYSQLVNAESWQDESREFSSRTSLLLKNGIAGFIIICLIMSLFVNAQIAFWTAVGVPVSIVGAAGAIHYLGIDLSLNAITLLGFLIALGMIVDDSLVIGESIHHSLAKNGDTNSLVIEGVSNVATPATFGMLTTAAAFLPLTLTEGDMGSKLGSVGMVVVFCLILSLIESKFVLPYHLKPSKGGVFDRITFLKKVNLWSNDKLDRFIKYYYEPSLRWAMGNPIKTILISIVTLVLSVGLIPVGIVKMAIIPNIADYALSAKVQFYSSLPPVIKSSLATQTVEGLREVGVDYKRKYELSYNPIRNIGYQFEGDLLIIDVELEEVEGTPYDAYDVQQSWREKIPNHPGIASLSIDAGSGSDEKIAFELSGDDLAAVRSFSNRLKSYLNSQEDVVDVRDSERSSTIEYQIELTEFARAIGVKEEAVINAVRYAFYGEEAQRVLIDQQDVRVLIRLDEANRNSVSAFQNMLVPIINDSGEKSFVPLEKIANIQRSLVSSEIRRIDKQRTITVYANTKPNSRSPEAVAEEVEGNVLPELKADFPNVSVTVEGEAKEANKSLSSMLSNSVLVLFALYALIALPCGSLRYPAMILFTIPLGLIGAVWGHALSGMTFSLMSIFGVIALSGVLINNTLLIVDQYRKYLKEGLSQSLSLERSCYRRFRPILLTSLTTLAGLLPLLWETDPEALWLIPIAISLGWGLIVATGLTMLVFPAIIMLMDRAPVLSFDKEPKANTMIEEV